MEKQSFDDFYDNNAETYGHPYLELQEYFKKKPIKGSLLDVGCGQGRDSLFLQSIGYQVTAIDNSAIGIQQMLEKTKSLELNITGIVADALQFETEEKFDIILFDMLLHSFEKEEQIMLLSKYSKLLNNEGVICIVFPDDMTTQYFMKLLTSISQQSNLEDDFLIKDVPKVKNDDGDYTFRMIVVQIPDPSM